MRTCREKKPPRWLSVSSSIDTVALTRVATAALEWTQGGWDAHPFASYPTPFLWVSAGDPYSDLAPNVGLARVPIYGYMDIWTRSCLSFQ